MPGFSKATAGNVGEFGPVTDRHEEMDGYTVTIVSFAADVDGAPLLRGAQDDLCQCPHWGYVVEGTATFTFADHVETFKAGDAFYVRPDTRQRTVPTRSWSCSARLASCAKPRSHAAQYGGDAGQLRRTDAPRVRCSVARRCFA